MGNHPILEDGHVSPRPARLAGLYARQVEEAGWLGLAGYLLFSLFFALTIGLSFTEAFILPLLATEAPKFVEGFLGIFNGHPGEMNLGALPTLYALAGFVVCARRPAVWHRDIPRRHPAALGGRSACRRGRVAPLVLALLPHPLDRIFAVPVGLALAWLGYALWSERREQATEPVPGKGGPQLRQTAAE